MARLQFEESSERTQAIIVFCGIYGVGPSKALEWYQRGLRTLEDVRANKNGIKLTPAMEVRP
jgi:hypothetical protein